MSAALHSLHVAGSNSFWILPVRRVETKLKLLQLCAIKQLHVGKKVLGLMKCTSRSSCVCLEAGTGGELCGAQVPSGARWPGHTSGKRIGSRNTARSKLLLSQAQESDKKGIRTWDGGRCFSKNRSRTSGTSPISSHPFAGNTRHSEGFMFVCQSGLLQTHPSNH